MRQSGRLLRLRSAGGRWTVTYKGPADQATHKSREEIETDVSDGPAFAQILAALGYQPSFAYEKFRTTFAIAGEEGIVTLDETPIGDFLELEGPGYWIDQTALRLGFEPADYITSSYPVLYEEYRQSTCDSTSRHEVPSPLAKTTLVPQKVLSLQTSDAILPIDLWAKIFTTRMPERGDKGQRCLN